MTPAELAAFALATIVAGYWAGRIRLRMVRDVQWDPDRERLIRECLAQPPGSCIVSHPEAREVVRGQHANGGLVTERKRLAFGRTLYMAYHRETSN